MMQSMDEKVTRALELAEEIHANQPGHYEHVLAVVEAVSERAKFTAALHDAVEDSPDGAWAIGLLGALGATATELEALALLTRGEESYEAYIERLIAAEGVSATAKALALEVKEADAKHNLLRSKEAGAQKRIAKYQAVVERVQVAREEE
jgi:hypothetical protein